MTPEHVSEKDAASIDIPETSAVKPKLLIVDDDEVILTQMKWGLGSDYQLFLAGEGETALALFQEEHPPLVCLDLGLPPYPRDEVEGMRVLKEILDDAPKTKVVIISGNIERANAIKAITHGAYDFFSKPIDLDELHTILKRALYLYEMEIENAHLHKKISENKMGRLEGESEAMQRIFSSIKRVASTDAPVLILGESGTGKELIAQSIHQWSTRQSAPFVPINCGSIPGELLEAELFGHEKGAFTGAHLQRKGKIEFAEGGTLFLDEIGEMPLALQVKLLRFLQDFCVVRVGGRQQIKVDIRVLAATNTDIEAAVKEGRFRSDLYFRLNVVTLQVPPLRNREGDIELLAQLFLQRFTKEYKKRLKGFRQDALDLLNAYAWPGNVRELENKIKRAIIMANGRFLTPKDLDLPETGGGFKVRSLKSIRDEAERAWILKVLSWHKGNISRSAADLEISRPSLYEAIERLGIQKGEYQG
ncbi:MAG: PEP-CTERM-box response regulator transcription factor [Nitrospiria bacterium]